MTGTELSSQKPRDWNDSTRAQATACVWLGERPPSNRVGQQ